MGLSPWLFPLFLCNWVIIFNYFYYFSLGLTFWVWCLLQSANLHLRQFPGRGLSCCFEQMGSTSLETGIVQPCLMAPRRMLDTRLPSGGGLEHPPVGYRCYTRVFLTTDSKHFSFSQSYFWSCILVLFVPLSTTETCCIEITDVNTEKGAEKWSGKEENWAVTTSSSFLFFKVASAYHAQRKHTFCLWRFRCFATANRMLWFCQFSSQTLLGRGEGRRHIHANQILSFNGFALTACPTAHHYKHLH